MRSPTPTPAPERVRLPAADTVTISTPAASLAQAHTLLTFTLALFVASVAIGLGWDRAWHATHVFDTFYSPPHVFSYAMALVTAYLVGVLTFSRELRAWFGPGLRVPPLPFAVPGALMLTGGGLGTLALAGLLDDIWHSNFGLDETGWSTPHAMIGWGLLATMLGFISCRLALARWRPLRWYTRLALGWLGLAFSARPIIGPLEANISPAAVAATRTLPVLLVQPAAQHTFRIYLAWNLTRTNPLYLALAALWAGAALAYLRRLERRTWLFLLTAALMTLLGVVEGRARAQGLDHAFHLQLARSPATWLPLPLFPAALTLALARRLRLGRCWSWLAAGALFALLSLLAWGHGQGPAGLAAALAAIPLFAGGARLGDWCFGTLARPERARVWLLVAAGMAAPFVAGAVDLYLRFVTP